MKNIGKWGVKRTKLFKKGKLQSITDDIVSTDMRVSDTSSVNTFNALGASTASNASQRQNRL